MRTKASSTTMALGVATVGDASQVLVGAVVGEDGDLLAVLLESALALRADAIGVDHAANGDDISFFEL